MWKGAYGARGNSRLAARARNGARQPGAEDGGRSSIGRAVGGATGSVSGGFSRARGPAQQADAGFDRATEARSTLPDESAGTGTREPATARGGGTNRPAIRGQGSPHRKVWVSWRRNGSFDPRLARGSVQHFAARTSVRSPWGARAGADRRVRARRSKVGSLEECPLTTESVAEIGERHLPNSGIIAAQSLNTAAQRRSKRV